MWILITWLFVLSGFIMKDNNLYFVAAIFALADSVENIAIAIKEQKKDDDTNHKATVNVPRER